MVRWLVCAAVMWAVLADCSRSWLSPEMLEVSLRNDKDQWELTRDVCGPVLLITSPSGIGAATARVLASRPCACFAVGLRYDEGQPFPRLEGFSVANDDGTVWNDLPWTVHSGYLRVALPQAAFDHQDSVLTIGWVDMYRTD